MKKKDAFGKWTCDEMGKDREYCIEETLNRGILNKIHVGIKPYGPTMADT